MAVEYGTCGLTKSWSLVGELYGPDIRLECAVMVSPYFLFCSSKIVQRNPPSASHSKEASLQSTGQVSVGPTFSNDWVMFQCLKTCTRLKSKASFFGLDCIPAPSLSCARTYAPHPQVCFLDSSGSYVPEGLLAEHDAILRAASNCLAYRGGPRVRPWW